MIMVVSVCFDVNKLLLLQWSYFRH